MLSWVSYVVIIVMLASIGVAWSKKFLAVGSLAVGNIIIHALGALGPRYQVVTSQGVFGIPKARAELALYPQNLYDLEPKGLLQLFTSMFLHADLGHLIGNLIVLLAFALAFEELIGPRKFIVAYLATGLLATFSHLAATWGGTTPLVGASGAVFGIIGAFAGTYPQLVMRLPIPLPILIFVRMKVIVAAMLFMFVQIMFQFLSSRSEALSGVAYAAHIGGLVAGLFLATVWLRRTRHDKDPEVRLDFAALVQFANDPKAKRAFEEMEANRNLPDVFAAWFEKFWETATDPETGQRVVPGPRGKVIREDGFEFDLRLKKA